MEAGDGADLICSKSTLELEGLTKGLPVIYAQETFAQAASVSIRGGCSIGMSSKGRVHWCGSENVGCREKTVP
jgi:hypothetical protein